MRLEYKYLVRIEDLDALRNDLLPYVDFDDFYNGTHEYTVRSIYFDTSELKFYHEKIEGIKIRKKLRIRGYNTPTENSIIFLEIKRKFENYIGKNRSALKYINLEEFMKTKDLESYIITENGFTNSLEDAEKFLHHIYKQSLKPINLIVYDREAFFSKFDPGLRLTFDKNLRFMMFPSMDKLYFDHELTKPMPKHLIFEIKFKHGFPNWLSKILNKYNLSRRALSKYTICIDTDRSVNPHRKKSFINRTDSFTPFHTYYEE